MADAGGDSNSNAGRGRRETGTHSVVFSILSLLSSVLLLSFFFSDHLLSVEYLQYTNRQDRLEQAGTGPTRAATATQDETEGQTGERRR